MATALLLRLPPPVHHQPSSLSLLHQSIPKIHFAAFRNGSTPPKTQCPISLDQQPINEYRAADLVEYCSRLLVTGASFALLVGLPVAFFGSAGHQSEPVRPALAAASSGLFEVTAVVRMHMGWSYVGNRLLSATVEYMGEDC